MSEIRFEWITGKSLIKKWNLDLRELHTINKNGLPVYNTNYEIEDKGPIYNKTPNPDYSPDSLLTPEYIVEKNNLSDFETLLETLCPFEKTGITVRQILNNLLFHMNDVEYYEKQHGFLDKDPNPIDFKIYDSIIHGDLRPYLEIYSSKNLEKNLMKELWILSFFKDTDGIYEYIDEFKTPFAETDDQARPTFITIINDKFEKLIDIDIPPPPDIKARSFLSFIDIEFNKIRIRAVEVLQTSSNEEQISLFANRNIQRLKEIAGQAHLLSKRLRTKSRSVLDKPNSYIIYILKIYLVRSIVFYQRLFQPYLKVPIQDEFELRMLLYGERRRAVNKKILRPNQKAKIECHAVAKRIWKKDPTITIAAMIDHPELIPHTKKKDGNLYTEKTVRNWIKDLCPDRSRGRRKGT